MNVQRGKNLEGETSGEKRMAKMNGLFGTNVRNGLEFDDTRWPLT